jgi:hypothetical protein
MSSSKSLVALFSVSRLAPLSPPSQRTFYIPEPPIAADRTEQPPPKKRPRNRTKLQQGEWSAGELRALESYVKVTHGERDDALLEVLFPLRTAEDVERQISVGRTQLERVQKRKLTELEEEELERFHEEEDTKKADMLRKKADLDIALGLDGWKDDCQGDGAREEDRSQEMWNEFSDEGEEQLSFERLRELQNEMEGSLSEGSESEEGDSESVLVEDEEIIGKDIEEKSETPAETIMAEKETDTIRRRAQLDRILGLR